MPREFYRSPNFDSEQPYRLAAIHIHTNEGLGGVESFRDILRVAQAFGINTVVFTDYNGVETSKKARAYVQSKGYSIEIVTGSEIPTKEGPHLLAIGIEDNIPPGLSLHRTLALIRKQEGLAIAAHPFFGKIAGGGSLRKRETHWLTAPLEYYDLTPLDEEKVPNTEAKLDGMEVLNGGVAARGSKANQVALDFYGQFTGFLGAAIGGSDTHNWNPALAITAFQGTDLCEAIRQKRTAVLYPDRQERQYQLNVALEILGEKVFSRVPTSVQRRIDRHIPGISVYAMYADGVSDRTAGQFLSPVESAKLQNMKDSSRPAWFSARRAIKNAYCDFNSLDLSVMRYLSVGNKKFDDHRSGPPYIENGEDLYYSLAHSGNIGMGAVADVPVGVDVEMVNYGRPPRIGLLNQEEIGEEHRLSPNLDLYEIGCKLSTIKEAVGKGLLLGNSRHSAFRLIPIDAESYVVEPFRNGVSLPLWQVKAFRRQDYFLTIALMTLADTSVGLKLNWIK